MSKIIIDLEKVLTEKGISKNKLCYGCQLQRTQLNKYCNNKVSRIDLHTLSKICTFIECDISDILRLEKDE